MSASSPIDPVPSKVPPNVWHIYNKRAKARDEMLLKDWGSTLNSLLIFAGIFAAVLTALCVESQKLLQEDPLESINDLMKFMVARELNASAPFRPPALFEASPWAVAVNGCFFASLTSSMVAAMAAVTCLQWVGEYDARLDDGSKPEDRALQRHYRYLAAKKWLMGSIIAMLPIMVYLTVILFFIGLIVWFWHINRQIALIPLVGISFWGGTYLITTILAAIYPSSPFKTQLSQALFRGTCIIYYCFWKILLSAPFYAMAAFNFIQECLISPKNALSKCRQQFIVQHIEFSQTRQMQLADAFRWMPAGRQPIQSMHCYVRERAGVANDPTLPLASLAWLANSIDISEANREELIMLLLELNKLGPEQLTVWPQIDYQVPWGCILNLVLSSECEFGSASVRLLPKVKEDVTELMVKMASHPKLFRMIVRDMKTDVMTMFAEHLPASPLPTSQQDAKRRMKSIITLLNSWQWERLESRQPVYPIVCAILHCLQGLFRIRGEQILQDEKEDVDLVQDTMEALGTVFGKSEKGGHYSNETQRRPNDAMFMIATLWMFTLCKGDKKPFESEGTHSRPRTQLGSAAILRSSGSIRSKDSDSNKRPHRFVTSTYTPETSWPNVSFSPNAFEYRQFREDAVLKYLEYIDAHLSQSSGSTVELPQHRAVEWRWSLAKGKPILGGRTAMMKILAEYILPIMVRMNEGNSVKFEDGYGLLQDYVERSCQSPVLRQLLKEFTTQSRMDDCIPSSISLELDYTGPIPKPGDAELNDETWLYVWERAFRLHDTPVAVSQPLGTKYSLSDRLQDLLVVMLTAERHPSLQASITAVLNRHISALSSEFWIKVLTFLRGKDDNLRRYTHWMLKASSKIYLRVLSGLQSSDSNDTIISSLLEELCSRRRSCRERHPDAYRSMQVQEGGDAYTRAFVDVLVGVGKVASPASSPPPEKVLKQILREVQVLVSSAHDQPRTVEEYARMRPMFETYRKVTDHIAKNWEQSDMDLDTVRQLLSTLAQQLPQLFPRLEYSDELPAIQDQHYATSDEMQNWEVIGMLAKKIDDHFMFILNPIPLSPAH